MFATKKTHGKRIMHRKKLFVIVLTIVLCAGMILPVHAAINPFAAMEARSHQALDAAIKAGTVPADTTIFDCMFTTGEDGVTRVIQYKDKNGNWIDVATQKKVVEQEKTDSPTDKANATQKLSEDTLAEYAAEVFRLVNEEREKAGLDPVVWDIDFANCAQIRAEELSIKYSHERPNPVNDGIEWPQNVSGKGIYNAPSVADEQGVPHGWIMENITVTRGAPESAVKEWMDSSGHRKNILRESHIRCGVGVYQTSEILYWALWFDDYTDA